jgi:hypothetical protein
LCGERELGSGWKVGSKRVRSSQQRWLFRVKSILLSGSDVARLR